MSAPPPSKEGKGKTRKIGNDTGNGNNIKPSLLETIKQINEPLNRDQQVEKEKKTKVDAKNLLDSFHAPLPTGSQNPSPTKRLSTRNLMVFPDEGLHIATKVTSKQTMSKNTEDDMETDDEDIPVKVTPQKSKKSKGKRGKGRELKTNRRNWSVY
ncbi:hypothetical protein PVAG01_02370 [Phlyctema vagabunda]|uniref:Uncharacterized protein n=1 Tax=Phlyctema vagabunda TaxID=108571 RepID=A0ABR4PQD3_9HELO